MVHVRVDANNTQNNIRGTVSSAKGSPGSAKNKSGASTIAAANTSSGLQADARTCGIQVHKKLENMDGVKLNRVRAGFEGSSGVVVRENEGESDLAERTCETRNSVVRKTMLQ